MSKSLQLHSVPRSASDGPKRPCVARDGHLPAASFKEAVRTHLYPRTVVDISLYIVADDGGILPACINATTLALVDAGIPMKDYVSGCATAMHGTDPLLDPCYVEESEVSFVTAGLIGSDSDNVSLLLLQNKMAMDSRPRPSLQRFLECASIRGMMDAEVRRHGASRKSKTISSE